MAALLREGGGRLRENRTAPSFLSTSSIPASAATDALCHSCCLNDLQGSLFVTSSVEKFEIKKDLGEHSLDLSIQLSS